MHAHSRVGSLVQTPGERFRLILERYALSGRLALAFTHVTTTSGIARAGLAAHRTTLWL